MNKSFYRFVLTYRNGRDDKAIFAEAMFEDLSFPKEEIEYDALAQYVEECGQDSLRPVIFDELYEIFQARNALK